MTAATLPAPTAAPAAPEPTRAQLLLAYRELRNHLWPDTLEATLTHPTFGLCLRQAARHRHRANPCAQRRVVLGAAHIVPPTQAAPPPTTAGRRIYALPTYDAKRAAANDRSDD